MNVEELKEKLRGYKKQDIIITDHTEVRAILREIDLEEVKNNIINPKKLVYIEEQKADKLNERNMDVILLIQINIVISMY